jgi:CPA2 family monovalent cation:H+ antiporter-2
LGADEVIPEEFETSVEIFTRVLAKYFITKDEIQRLVAEVKSDGYEMFRDLSKTAASFCDWKLELPDVDIRPFRTLERSALIGKILGQIELRKRYGFSVVAIKRDQEILTNLGAGTMLQSDDELFVLGPMEKIAAATDVLHEREAF